MPQSYLDNYKKFLQSAVISLTPPPPQRIMLEITNRCNHQCLFCAHSSMTRAHTTMDIPLCERILEECHDLGSNECALHGGSEPFLHPEIDTIIALTKKYNYQYVYLSTNGSACTEEKMTAALEAGLDSIKFSINGGSREEYKKIHGVDAFDRALRMLEYVIDWKEKNNRKLKIFISAIKCPDNGQISLLKEKYDKIINAVEIADVMWTGKDTKLPKECTIPISNCVEIFNRTTFTADGGMRICCNDADNYTLIDSIINKSILEVWNGDLYMRMRQCFLDHKLPSDSLCHACVMFQQQKIRPLNEIFSQK